jgi:hypothetical protein
MVKWNKWWRNISDKPKAGFISNEVAVLARTGISIDLYEVVIFNICAVFEVEYLQN